MTTSAHLPTTIIHAGETCVAEPAAKIGKHVVELRHGEHLGPNVPVLVGLCECCAPMSDQDMRRVSDAALAELAPMHALRQNAVAMGAALVDEKGACERLKVGRSKFWELIAAGRLPQPMKRGRNNVWLLDELLTCYARTLRPAT